MFQIPLSIRHNITTVSEFTPTNSSSLIHNDHLFILLNNSDNIHIVIIPLLAQEEEKVIPIEVSNIKTSRITIKENIPTVQVLTDSHYYELDPLENNIVKTKMADLNTMILDTTTSFKRIIKLNFKVTNPRIFDGAIISNNQVYQISDDSLIHRRISPYFYSILHLEHFNNFMCYSLKNEIRIYKEDELILKKRIKSEFTFQVNEFILTVVNNLVLVHRLNSNNPSSSSSTLELFFKIDINMEIKADWKYGFYNPGTNTVILSGVSRNTFVAYVDGYLFETPTLISEFFLFRGTFFGVSDSVLYFLPNDPDFDLKFTRQENERIYEKIKESKEGNSKVEDNITGKMGDNSGKMEYNSKSNININSNTSPKTNISPNTNTPVGRNFRIQIYTGKRKKVGHFLSYILFFGTRILAKKIILTTENIDQLLLCLDFLKFDSSIYETFLSYEVDPDQIYGIVSSDWIKINRNLLIEMIRRKFVEVESDLKEFSAEYFYLKGKFNLSNGLDYYDDFVRCLSVGTIMTENTMVECSIDSSVISRGSRRNSFNIGVEFNIDELLIRHGKIEDLLKLNKCGLIPRVRNFVGLKEQLFLAEDKYTSIRILRTLNITEGDRELLVDYCDGNYLWLVGMENIDDLIFNKSVQTGKYLENAVEYFVEVGNFKCAVKLKWILYEKSGRKECLDGFGELIGDYVFVWNGRFVGREVVEKREIVVEY